MSLVWMWLGCTGTSEPPPPPASPPPVQSGPVVVLSTTDAPSEAGVEPITLELQYVGVGELHQRWFGDVELSTALAKALSPCLSGRAVVRMTWSEEERVGHIWLLTSRDQLRCTALPGGDLAPITPLGKALASYRDGVSNRFDFRVSGFRVGLEVLHKTDLCRVQLGGQYPPDGSGFSGCVDLGGEQVCLPESKGPHTTFAFTDPAHTAYLGRCFQ